MTHLLIFVDQVFEASLQKRDKEDLRQEDFAVAGHRAVESQYVFLSIIFL